jgi:hypothetical protein
MIAGPAFKEPPGRGTRKNFQLIKYKLVMDREMKYRGVDKRF